MLDGSSDWWLPEIDQLAALYDASSPYHTKGGMIRVARSVWSFTKAEVANEFFDFSRGKPDADILYSNLIAANGALCVTNARRPEVQVAAPSVKPVDDAGGPGGVWVDRTTGLAWTLHDNGSYVEQKDADAYCSGLRLGGHTGWQLPEIDQLKAIYDASSQPYHTKDGIRLTGWWYWSSPGWGSNGLGQTGWFSRSFNFRLGQVYYGGGRNRALCVLAGPADRKVTDK